jgi:hypothetical protein
LGPAAAKSEGNVLLFVPIRRTMRTGAANEAGRSAIKGMRIARLASKAFILLRQCAVWESPSASTYVNIRLESVERLAIVAYESDMPNRKTFDEREKVDHSSHPLMHRQPSDLKADIQDPKDEVATAPSTGELPQRQIDKPDNPNYAGGEDEHRGSHKPSAKKTQKPENFPVDGNDSDSASTSDSGGEG